LLGTFIVFSAIITSPLVMLYFSIRGAWTAHRAAQKAKAEGAEPPKPALDTSEEIARSVEEAQLKVKLGFACAFAAICLCLSDVPACRWSIQPGSRRNYE